MKGGYTCSNFNSIKVQLKQRSYQNLYYTIPYFNSIKVQLKHVHAKDD